MPLLFVLLSILSLAAVIYPFRPFGTRLRALFLFFIFAFLAGVFAPSSGLDLPRVSNAESSDNGDMPMTVSADVESPPIIDENVEIEQPNAASERKTPGDNDDNGLEYWVVSDRLNRRTCPSTDCGIVGQFFFREKATVLEAGGGWARVTQYYDAACVGGLSEYVDAGNARCDSENGIESGQLAEWVSIKYLSMNRPPDPGADAAGDADLVARSDDYMRHKDTFLIAAMKLISAGRCTREDFIENGGWWKSTSHRNGPIYFVYCGESHVSNRIYLDASSGDLFQ